MGFYFYYFFILLEEMCKSDLVKVFSLGFVLVCVFNGIVTMKLGFLVSIRIESK